MNGSHATPEGKPPEGADWACVAEGAGAAEVVRAVEVVRAAEVARVADEGSSTVDEEGAGEGVGVSFGWADVSTSLEVGSGVSIGVTEVGASVDDSMAVEDGRSKVEGAAAVEMLAFITLTVVVEYVTVEVTSTMESPSLGVAAIWLIGSVWVAYGMPFSSTTIVIVTVDVAVEASSTGVAAA